MPIRKSIKEQARIVALKWMDKHPIDAVWREHFKIPFGSKEHFSVDLIDQYIWYEEKKLMKEMRDNPDVRYDAKGRVIIEDRGFGSTEEEIDKAFEELDINKLNEEFEKNKKS